MKRLVFLFLFLSSFCQAQTTILSGSPINLSGAYTLTLTLTGNTNVTLPTSGTLVNSSVATLSSLSSIGTITTGTWHGTGITVAYGGTGLATATAHGVLIGEGTNALAVTAAGTTGQILESSGSSADPVWGGAHLGLYGSGGDNSVTFDGSTTILGIVPSANVYTLARDIFPSSMTVNNGVSIKTVGYRIYCSGTITNNGTIHNNGNNGSGATAGATTGTVGPLGGGSAGGAGGSTGAGSGGSSGGAAGAGGAGGTGGISGQGQAGGAGSAIVAPVIGRGGANAFYSFYSASVGHVIGAGTSTQIQGGTGGGGGGGAQANSGGGGGGGGGPLLISAYKIDNTNGTISANGGTGGNASGTNAGTGAGGGGGVVFLIYHSFVGNAATATKGTAGPTKTGTGIVGADGSDGNVISIQN